MDMVTLGTTKTGKDECLGESIFHKLFVWHEKAQQKKEI